MSKKLSYHVEQMLAAKNVAVDTQAGYRRVVRQFSEWLNKPAKLKHLTESTVNAWLISMDGKVSETTIHNRHRSIKTIWNHLAELDLVEPYNVRRLRKTRNAPKVVEAWTMEQANALLAGARDVPGMLECGVKASEMLRAYILVGCETGLRPSDMRRLKPCQVNTKTRRINLTIHKTGVQHSVEIGPQTVTALRPLLEAEGETLFKLNKAALYRWSCILFSASEKHGFARKGGQGLGVLRKLHATEVCKVLGLDAAARSLGHVSGSTLARKHYVEADAIEKPKLVSEISRRLTG